MLKRFIKRLVAGLVKYLPLIVDLASKVAIAFVFIFALHGLTHELQVLDQVIRTIPNHEDQYKEILQQHDQDQKALADLSTRFDVVEAEAKQAASDAAEIKKASKVRLR